MKFCFLPAAVKCHGFVPDPPVFVGYPGRLPELWEPLGSTHPSFGNKHREQHPGKKLLWAIPKPQGTWEVLLIKEQAAVSKGRNFPAEQGCPGIHPGRSRIPGKLQSSRTSRMNPRNAEQQVGESGGGM